MSTTTLKNRLASKTTAVEANDLATTTLLTNTTEYAALNGNALEIIEENLKNQPMSLQLLVMSSIIRKFLYRIFWQQA